MDGRNTTYSLEPLTTIRGRMRTGRTRAIDSGCMMWDFRNGTLPANISWARSSSATFINAAGNVVTVGLNIPRFEIFGGSQCLLAEGAATNLLNHSETFATSGGTQNNWLDSSITRVASNATAPDGNATALRIQADANNGSIISTTAQAASAQRTFSIWLRRVNGSGTVELTANNGTNWFPTSALTGTWQRYTLTSSTTQQVGVRLTVAGDRIEIWGAQLEVGFAPTSYIATTTSTASRSADWGALNTLPNGTLPLRARYGQYLGSTGHTLLIEAAYTQFKTAASYPRPVAFGNVSGQSLFGVFLDLTGLVTPFNYGWEQAGDISGSYLNATIAQSTMFTHVFSVGQPPVGLATITYRHAINGTSLASGSLAENILFNLNRFHLNLNTNADLPICRFRRIQYWPSEMNDYRLRELSAS